MSTSNERPFSVERFKPPQPVVDFISPISFDIDSIKLISGNAAIVREYENTSNIYYQNDPSHSFYLQIPRALRTGSSVIPEAIIQDLQSYKQDGHRDPIIQREYSFSWNYMGKSQSELEQSLRVTFDPFKETLLHSVELNHSVVTSKNGQTNNTHPVFTFQVQHDQDIVFWGMTNFKKPVQIIFTDISGYIFQENNLMGICSYPQMLRELGVAVEFSRGIETTSLRVMTPQTATFLELGKKVHHRYEMDLLQGTNNPVTDASVRSSVRTNPSNN